MAYFGLRGRRFGAGNRTALLLSALSALLVLSGLGDVPGTGHGMLGGAPSAWAGQDAEPLPSETIAITKLPFQGMAPEVVTELLGKLTDGLRAGGFTILSAQQVDNKLAQEQGLLACSTPRCYGRLAQVLGVRRVIEGEVQRLELSTFAMKLHLRDLFTGKLSEPVIERCDVCSNDDVKQMIVRAADKLVRTAPPRGPQDTDRPVASSGILVVETEPPGAQVSIDNVPRVERTPASYLLAAGVHSLVVRGAGYRPLRQQIEIPAGSQPITMRLSLSALSQRRPWLTALSVITTVGAVGLAAGSAALLYFNNKPVNTSDCPDQPGIVYHCPMKYDNLVPGVSLAIGAGVLAVGAGVMFYLDNASPKVKPIVETTP
jgi:hypothetical protein